MSNKHLTTISKLQTLLVKIKDTHKTLLDFDKDAAEQLSHDIEKVSPDVAFTLAFSTQNAAQILDDLVFDIEHLLQNISALDK